MEPVFHLCSGGLSFYKTTLCAYHRRMLNVVDKNLFDVTPVVTGFIT